MTQGIWLKSEDGAFYRPKSKREIKDTLPERVNLEATSLLGSEYNGPVSAAPIGTYYFVGPDPYTARKFYGQIVVSDSGQIFVR